MKSLPYRFASLFLALFLIVTAAAPAAANNEGMFDVQFAGVINTVDPWQVAGHALAVNNSTQIVLTTGSVAPDMWATVQASRQPDDSLLAQRIVVQPPEMRLKGPVQSKPADGLGIWTIAGQAVKVDAQTRINLRPGPVEVDAWVEVVAVEDAGALRALRMHAVEACEDVLIVGAIQAFGAAWRISSVQVATNNDSLVIGEPEVGLLAHAIATLQDDDSLLGKTFHVSWMEPEHLRQPVQLRGIVEKLPPDGLIGAWTVAGKAVEVTSATRTFQIKGLVMVGAEVHVIGWQQDDTIVAAVVTVLKSPIGGVRWFYFRGEIQQMPDNGLFGKWVIDGKELLVTQQTFIMGKENARVGATGEVGGVQMQNGTRLTTWLRIQDRTGSGPGPGPTQPLTSDFPFDFSSFLEESGLSGESSTQ